MKRSKLIRYLVENGCYLVRQGARHSVYSNPRTHLSTTVPRHTEINDSFAEVICKQLGLPKIRKGK